MKYNAVLEVGKVELERINDLLSLTGEQSYNKYGLKEDEIIVETVKFSNGNFADVKLVIADDDSYNWTECVLFNSQGNELAYSEPSDTYTGEWLLFNNGDTYTVIVVEK